MQEISLHIMDIVQNSITAKATLIRVALEYTEKYIVVKIEDNGCGMSKEMLKDVISPFVTTRTTRKVGMGISLFAQGTQLTEGSFSIDSKEGVGTSLEATYGRNHIDRAPVGDFIGTVHTLIVCNPNIDFIIEILDGGKKEMDTRQVREVLGEEVPLNTPDVSLWLKENLEEMSQGIDFN